MISERVALPLPAEEQRLATLLSVTRVLAASADVTTATPRFLEAICEGMGFARGVAWRIDAQANLLRFADAWQAPGRDAARFREASRAIALAPGAGLPG